MHRLNIKRRYCIKCREIFAFDARVSFYEKFHFSAEKIALHSFYWWPFQFIFITLLTLGQIRENEEILTSYRNHDGTKIFLTFNISMQMFDLNINWGKCFEQKIPINPWYFYAWMQIFIWPNWYLIPNLEFSYNTDHHLLSR